jgi:SAM-dependent methyltransferase
MHPINRALALFGVGIHRKRSFPRAFLQAYHENLQRVKSASLQFKVVEDITCDIGEHPATYKEYECGFAASALAACRPNSILDIGSYRDFVLGLSAAYHVTSLDVREAPKISDQETIVVSDAKALTFPDDHFDAIVSLSSLEHFGLGRYGDEFDLSGDAKALGEMKRCLKPGGHLIFSTTLTTGEPCLVYNMHRIYSRPMLQELCAPLSLVQEKFYSHRLRGFIDLSQISDQPEAWDVYCGCWRKNSPFDAR